MMLKKLNSVKNFLKRQQLKIGVLLENKFYKLKREVVESGLVKLQLLPFLENWEKQNINMKLGKEY